MARSHYSHRPALDGVRGLAMLTFMAFHLGVSALQGAWVAVNVFFVLSGFLIVRLLLQEQVTYGDIRLLDFYRRRMRRLLPALFVLLASLMVYGLAFADDAVRRPLRADVLATLGYVMNWRLVLRDDQYFETFGNPSFLRHAWTLAVEEQFYLVAPVLVTVLAMLLWRRGHQAAVLLVLAGVSAAWTAHVGLGSASAQAHAYYGTDTRVQALLIGAALAFLLGPKPSGHDPRPLPPIVIAVLGWGGLAAMLAGYLFIPPFASWMFGQGGMALFSLAFAGLVLACADARRSALTTVLGQRPLAYLGRLSYGLYLWHWPIHLWLQQLWPGLSVAVRVPLGIGLTVAIAAASYRWVERPVLRGGVRALVPGGRPAARLAVGGSVLALVAASYTVGNVAAAGPAVSDNAEVANGLKLAGKPGPSIPLVPGSPTYRPGGTPITVGVYGDSVPWSLLYWYPKERYPDLNVVNLAVPGCDMLDLKVRFNAQVVQENDQACRTTKANFDQRLRSSRAQVFTIFGSPLLSFDHLSADGRVLHSTDPELERAVTSRLDQLAGRARAAGVSQVQLVTVPCRDRSVGFLDAVDPKVGDRAADPKALNAVLRGWAAAHDVAVLDLYSVLGCERGFTAKRNGLRLYGDQIHFSADATPMLWTWLAPQIRSAFTQRAGSDS